MRIKRTETKVYSFDELSDESKEKAVRVLYDVNLFYEWWESTFEDAKNVGIVIEEFEIDRGSYCRGTIDDKIDTARAILKEHGDSCETWQTAKDFHDAVAKDGDETTDFDILCDEFYCSIMEDYRIILQKEYEYLSSEDAIIETIKLNEYEFTENGNLA